MKTFQEFLNESKQRQEIEQILKPITDVNGISIEDFEKKAKRDMGKIYRTMTVVDAKTAEAAVKNMERAYKKEDDRTTEDDERIIKFEPEGVLIKFQFNNSSRSTIISAYGKQVKGLTMKGDGQASGPEAAFTKLAKTVLPGGKGTTVDTKEKTFSARWSTNKGLSGPEKQISKIVSNAESAGFKLDKTNNVDSPDGNVSGYDSTYKRRGDGASLEIRVRIGGRRNTFEAELTADPKKMK